MMRSYLICCLNEHRQCMRERFISLLEDQIGRQQFHPRVQQFSSGGPALFTKIYTESYVSEELTGQSRLADGQEFAVQVKPRDREVEDAALKVYNCRITSLRSVISIFSTVHYLLSSGCISRISSCRSLSLRCPVCCKTTTPVPWGCARRAYRRYCP